MKTAACVFIVLLVRLFAGTVAQQSRPHIIYILADDMGWNDVGFTGRSELQTPNIDALAYNGRILTQHYALPSCTPSRTAFLTGKYPIRTGMQGYPLSPTEPRGMPLDQILFPQYMKQLGYQTRLVGKWHLGYHEWKYTPTARKAFDSHYGYFNGFIGYYSHFMAVRGQTGHDFWRDSEPLYNLTGRYVTHLLTEESIRLIREARPDGTSNKAPLFLFLAHLAPHAGNPGADDLEAPAEDLARFSYIPDERRRKYAAMVWNLDKSVGQIVQALADNGMLSNSIIVFASDNGAQTEGMYANDGSNYPMQGLKFSIKQGGVRTIAAVWSPLLHGGGRGVSKQLFHMADWFPTLYAAAGGNMRELSGLDGKNQWPALLTPPTGQEEMDEYATRHELLVNIDETFGQESLIYRNYKLLKGTYNNQSYDGFYGSKYLNFSYTYNPTDIAQSVVNTNLRSFMPNVANSTNIMEQRKKTILHCYPETTKPEQIPKEVPCNPVEEYCLFDIHNDPCERINLAATQPQILTLLKAKLQTYDSQRKNQLNLPNDPDGANPEKFNNTWVCWRSGMPNNVYPGENMVPTTTTIKSVAPPGITTVRPFPTPLPTINGANQTLILSINLLLTCLLANVVRMLLQRH